MTGAETITVTLPASLLSAAAGWFLNQFLAGRAQKPPKTACLNCPYHADHEERIRKLEAHSARMEESIPDIRNDIRDVKNMINTVLLRLGGHENQ